MSDITITAYGGGIKNYVSGKQYLRCGILITTSKNGSFKDITSKELYFRDVFLEEEGFNRGDREILTGNSNQDYGWGIRAINANKNANLKHISITNCIVENVAHSGIRFTGDHELTLSQEKIYNT